MARDFEDEKDARLREGEEVEVSVRAVYRILRRPFDADMARSDLTVPQMNAIEELTRKDGLSLKELSERMSLSHSTVSGIVDRLERRGLVERRVDQKDRRYRRIFLSEEVREYVRIMRPSRRSGPIPKALELASEEEREKIISGVRLLRDLLEKVVSDHSDDLASRGVAEEQEGRA